MEEAAQYDPAGSDDDHGLGDVSALLVILTQASPTPKPCLR